MNKEEAMFAVTDRLKGHKQFEEFNKSDNGGDFWNSFNDAVDNNDSTVFLLKLKHRIDEQIEDQVLYLITNAAGAVPSSE